MSFKYITWCYIFHLWAMFSIKMSYPTHKMYVTMASSINQHNTQLSTELKICTACHGLNMHKHTNRLFILNYNQWPAEDTGLLGSLKLSSEENTHYCISNSRSVSDVSNKGIRFDRWGTLSVYLYGFMGIKDVMMSGRLDRIGFKMKPESPFKSTWCSASAHWPWFCHSVYLRKKCLCRSVIWLTGGLGNY